MRVSSNCIKLIKEFEGCELEAYPDPGTNGEPYTIGYGSTGENITEGMVITQEEAEQLLIKDLERFENGVSSLVKVLINQNQFDALVCFAYNVGLNNLKNSTLLKKVNNNDILGASKEFIRWNKAAGRILNGLTKRRIAESKLFLV